MRRSGTLEHRHESRRRAEESRRAKNATGAPTREPRLERRQRMWRRRRERAGGRDGEYRARTSPAVTTAREVTAVTANLVLAICEMSTGTIMSRMMTTSGMMAAPLRGLRHGLSLYRAEPTTTSRMRTTPPFLGPRNGFSRLSSKVRRNPHQRAKCRKHTEGAVVCMRENTERREALLV